MRYVAQPTLIQGWWVLDKLHGRYGRVVAARLSPDEARREAAARNGLT